MRDPEAVREMFSAISPRYDLLNHLLSAGRDRAWRKRAIELLDPSPGGLLLDLCGGTGDLSIEAARRGARVVCLDFSAAMLRRACEKFARFERGQTGERTTRRPVVRRRAESHFGQSAAVSPRCLLADALRLPFPDGAFEGVTIGFGLRNLRTIEEGLGEILRVLAPGGRACVLEFSRPSAGPLAAIYGVYLNRLLPRIGSMISRREGPYGYLARSIGEFPRGEALAELMSRGGFGEVRWTPLTGGIVAVHLGRRDPAPARESLVPLIPSGESSARSGRAGGSRPAGR